MDDHVLKDVKKAYETVGHPASFSGPQRLRRELLKSEGIRLTDKQARDFVIGQNTYTLHRPARVNYVRNRVFVSRPYNEWQSDLVDMSNLSRFNSGFRWLLTVIDCFSKRAHVRAIKDKSASSVAEAFDDVLKQSEHAPRSLQTDKGREYYNAIFKDLMEKYNIRHFSTNSAKKASIVERFNKTLKTRMYSYFTHANTNRWIDVLDTLVSGYNDTFHSSIKMTPNEVTTEPKIVARVFENLYGALNTRKKKRKKPSFAIGDHVRLSKVKAVFDKSYTPNWTTEIFTVRSIIPRDPYVYEVQDIDGEPILGNAGYVNVSLSRIIHK